jgi:uncharacterized protein (TIGR04255 family)
MFPSHAIERCVATVTFSEALPAKFYQKVLERARTITRTGGLDALTTPSAMVGFQIDASTGRASPLTGPGPSVFATADRAMQLIVASNSLTLRTGRYVRWQPFAGELEELLLPLVDNFVEVLSISNIQLEYLDRFLWTGDWSTFQWRELLMADGQFVAGTAAAASAQWHTHSGWFQDEPGFRRLVNVNIDVGDAIPIPIDSPADGPQAIPAAMPSVGVLTLMRDDQSGRAPEMPVKYENSPSVQAGLERLHIDLKALLMHILTPQMNVRIGLAE